MPTYLIFDAADPTPEIKEMAWKNPRVIDTFWFGDSGTNARSLSAVFPNTPKARAELDKVCELYLAAKEAKDRALSAQMEVINMKVRGELE